MLRTSLSFLIKIKIECFRFSKNVVTFFIVNFVFLISVPEIILFKKKFPKISIPPVITYGDLFLHFYITFHNSVGKPIPVLIFNENLDVSIGKVFGSDAYILYRGKVYDFIFFLTKLLDLKNIRKIYHTKILKYLYSHSKVPPFDRYDDLTHSFKKELISNKYSICFKKAASQYFHNRCRLFHIENINLNQRNIKFGKEEINNLKMSLGIKGKYCVMHIKFAPEGSDPRASKSIDSYRGLLNMMLNDGFTPVIMGTSNDYINIGKDDLSSVIKYYETSMQSPENDIKLVSGSEFYVGSGGGVSVLPYITGRPALILDSLTFADWHNWSKYLFYPKLVYDDRGNIVSINELIEMSSFFSMSAELFSSNGYSISSLLSEDIENAYTDFIDYIEGNQLVSKQEDLYDNFAKKLSPLHLGLFRDPKMICISYLEKTLKLD